MRATSIIWGFCALWIVVLTAAFISTQMDTAHDFGGDNMVRLGPPAADVMIGLTDALELTGLDFSSIANEYASFDPERSGAGTDIQHINPYHPEWTDALYVFGLWAVLSIVICWILTRVLRRFSRRSHLQSGAYPSSVHLESQYGDFAMALLLIGVVLAIGTHLVFERIWMSAGVLAIYLILAVQRYLNRQRLERFKTFQLYLLNQAVRALNRTEVAKVHATVSNELTEQHRMTGKLWISSPQSLPLTTIMQEVVASQTHVDTSHQPREQLAIELERLRVQNQYAYAEHVRQIKELAITNQQRRWELLTKEVTELRKVIVAVYEELSRNPALAPSLHEMFMRLNTFQTFMEDMRQQGTMDDTKAGRMMDELFTKTFQANINDLLRPRSGNGQHAQSRN